MAIIFFFSLQQNMDNFLFSYPLPPPPKKKEIKKRKKERKIQRKREHVNEILIILIFLNVVLNIEIIFVTGQGYIMLIYRRVKLINQNRAFFFFWHIRIDRRMNMWLTSFEKTNHTHVKMWWELYRHLLLQDETKITTTLSGLAATVCNKISLPPTCIAISVASS